MFVSLCFLLRWRLQTQLQGNIHKIFSFITCTNVLLSLKWFITLINDIIRIDRLCCKKLNDLIMCCWIPGECQSLSLCFSNFFSFFISLPSSSLVRRTLLVLKWFVLYHQGRRSRVTTVPAFLAKAMKCVNAAPVRGVSVLLRLCLSCVIVRTCCWRSSFLTNGMEWKNVFLNNF